MLSVLRHLDIRNPQPRALADAVNWSGRPGRSVTERSRLRLLCSTSGSARRPVCWRLSLGSPRGALTWPAAPAGWSSPRCWKSAVTNRRADALQRHPVAAPRCVIGRPSPWCPVVINRPVGTGVWQSGIAPRACARRRRVAIPLRPSGACQAADAFRGRRPFAGCAQRHPVAGR